MRLSSVTRRVLGVSLAALVASSACAAELWIGAATTDITPARPVALDGQFKTRISEGVDSPISATAVAVEGREGDHVTDQAVLLSMDLLSVHPSLRQPLRDRLKVRCPGFDPRKLVMTATHNHTAPVIPEGWYQIPSEGVMQPKEYKEFLLKQLEEVVSLAWERRHPGGVSWGLGHAVVGHNRRAVYDNGSARMYGSTRDPAFRFIEGGADAGVGVLFFWSDRRELLAAGVNVPCPAQVLEHQRTLSADFWHEVRQALRTQLANDSLVLAWPGACGDLSPRVLYRKAAEERMLKLRRLTLAQEIGRRISREVLDVCALVRDDVRTDVPFCHRVEQLALPVRRVTEDEVAQARKELEALKEKGDRSLRNGWLQATITRHQNQDKNPTFTVDVHVLRIGDIAIATSPFELFEDYGVQIEARSRAEQTFVIELTDGWEQYLPTARAVTGGGYSAIIQSNRGGPEAGQMLVERTVEMINALWPSDADVRPAARP